MKPRRAFTLIELMIVVIVIAGLIAIVVPSMAHARFIAKRTVCLTHCRELSRSYSLYISDWNAVLPKSWSASDPTRTTTTCNVWSFPLAAYGCVDKVRQCPEAIDLKNLLAFGSATTAWDEFYIDVAPSPAQRFDAGGAYALNSWPSAVIDLPNGHGLGTVSTPLIMLRWMRNTQQVPLFADANWSETIPSPSDAAPADLQQGSTALNDQMGRVCIARHRKSVNVAFYDGHAENTPLQQLWTLNWTPGWMPPAKLPIP